MSTTGREPWGAWEFRVSVSEEREKPFGHMRVLGLTQGRWQVAAHLGTGGHGDIQVAEDVLCVFILHRLPQERQEPSWLTAAVPYLSHTQGASARPFMPLDWCAGGGGGVPAS